MTPYLIRLLNGDMPSPDDWSDYLIAFHRKFADATAGQISQLRTVDGRSSYQLLSDHIQGASPTAQNILELGCGAGALLRELRTRYAPTVRLHGVDLSEDEIDRARNSGIAADFEIGDLRTCRLEEGVYDAAVAHLVLLVMSDPASVLTRVRAALRKGGALVLALEAQPQVGTLGTLLGAGVEALRGRHPGFLPAVPQGARLGTNEDIIALLRSAGFVNAIGVEATSISGLLSLDQLWDFIRRLYPFAFLNEELTGVLRQVVMQSAEAQLVDGAISIEMPLRIVTAYA